MAIGRNDHGHDLGAGSPGVLLRSLACTDGEMDIEVSYAPRPEYGLIHPILEAVPGGLAARGGAGRLLLSAPPGLRIDGATATARLHVAAGQTVSFALQHGQMWEPPLAAWDAGEIAARLADTLDGWRSWSAIHQTYEGPWRDLVHHSGRVLYGEMLGAAQRLVEQLGVLDPVTQQFLAAAADTGASRWKEKDQGIWEIRGEARDFLYSKLMCWVALDRAIALAPQLGAQHRVEDWATARDEIRAAILEHGWSEQAGAYTQAFGSDDLDASNLMLAITGFLAGDDPRMKATIDATADRLTDKRGLAYRYVAHDGLAGEEGTFLLCTFWLAQAQALAGELDQATATFERAVAAINDVGLLAEEVDAGSGEMIGNFPQAFSHIGLINAAWAIAQARQRAGRDPLAASPGKAFDT